MNYRVLELDSEGRLAQPCPKCENKHPTGNFCSVCGSEIIKHTKISSEESPTGERFTTFSLC